MYIAGKARPRSGEVILVDHVKSLGRFDHGDRIPCGIEGKEGDDGHVAVMTRAPPAAVQG